MKLKTFSKFALPVVLAALSMSVAARDFRAADNQPNDYPTVLALKFIGEEVSKSTNGKYNVKVFPNSTLGSGKDAIEQVKIGAIDMTRVSTSEFHGIIPESVVPSFPFLYRDIDHFRNVVYGPIGDEILNAFEKHGYIALCMYEAGARSIYAKKKILSVADTKGLKIRVQPSDLWVSLVNAMGSTAVPIPYGEVYTALKTGLVDAAENNYPSYETSKHFEAANIYSETQHVLAPDVVVFSKKVWDTLPKEEQDIIRKAAKDSIPYFSKLWIAKEEAAKKVVVDAGVIIVPAKDINHDSFVAAVKPVWDKYANTPELKALVQKILDSK